MHVFVCICTYFGFLLLAHPFSPSCFLQISAHQAPILVSKLSFQSFARRHSSMQLLNPPRLPRRWLALAAARAAARAAAPAAAVSSSSPPRTIMALMSTGPATAAESTPTAEKAIKGFVAPPAHQNPRISQKLNTDVNTM